jgi:DNA-directed RNA polymerase specialized sigma24 family protein
MNQRNYLISNFSCMWLADTRTSVQEEVEQNEFAKSLQRLLDELPDAYRRVLTAHRYL